MKEHVAVELDQIDFSPFGQVVRLASGGQSVVSSAGDGWSGVFTQVPMLEQAGSLGYTSGIAAPCITRTMERHHHTKEALFTNSGPVLLAVAATASAAPRSEDIHVVIIRHGDLVILNEGTWHDACHGLGEEMPYYWYASCDPSIIDPWVPIEGGPVHLSY